MTPNNPEQSNCCKAPITLGGDVRTGFYVCTECQRACDVYVPYESVRRLPEQNKPEWLENHFCRFNDGEHSCECFVDGYKTGKGQVKLDLTLEPPEPWEPEFDYKFADNTPWISDDIPADDIKAFIRKIYDQAYERGEKEGKAHCIKALKDRAKYWAEELKKGPCVTENDEGEKFDWQMHAHRKNLAMIDAYIELENITPKSSD